MKIKHLTAIAAMICTTATMSAQTYTEYRITGQLMSPASFNYTDILKLSQFNTAFGTARSTAMGGAFTSLGGDLASMNINPAGLGMYRSSEFTLSPSMTFSRFNNKNQRPGVNMFGSDNSKNQFAINNIGAAFNVYQGSGALTSVTFGVGYNKLADFNTHTSVGLPNEDWSLGDIFAIQMGGTSANDIKGDKAWRYLPPNMWGAAMAYKTLLLDAVGDHDPVQDPNREMYRYYTLADDAQISNHAFMESKGSVGEISLSGGFNIRNMVYLGFAFGFQNIYMRQNIYYDETFTNNTGQPGRPAGIAPASGFIYDQNKVMYGDGFNVKVGAIIRPIDPLRIGIAVHTPTFASVKMKYQAYMATSFVPYDPVPDSDPSYSATNIYKYHYQTPTRLLLGASWTFGDKGLISADYERTWYNGMRLVGNNVPTEMKSDYKAEIKHHFKGGNTFRVGGEFKPIPAVAIRAGFSHAGSFINEDVFNVKLDSFDSPVAYQTYNISAGLGFRLGRSASLDLAYVYMNTKYTVYDMFVAQEWQSADGNNWSNVGEILSGKIEQKHTRHNAIMSLSFKF